MDVLLNPKTHEERPGFPLGSRARTITSRRVSLKLVAAFLVALYVANLFLMSILEARIDGFTINGSNSSSSSSSISTDSRILRNQTKKEHNYDDTTTTAATTPTATISTTTTATRPKEVDSHSHQKEENFLPRVLAILFPQFHSDPLNDYLWGKGFTDWENLRNAPSTNRNGYRIPRPTSLLGYYNLTETEPRRTQGELAKAYGIDGFIYHHYWFYDKAHPGPTLHAPLVNMLKDGHPDVPFALHWCAVKWTNTWSGNVGPDFVFKGEGGVLQKQYFPTEMKDPNITDHYNWLKQFFHHPNYIKVDGDKPLFMLYQKKPGAMVVLKRLRELAIEDGFGGLYFTVGLTKPHEHLMQNVEVEPKLSNRMKAEVERVLGFNLYNKLVSYPNPSEWAANRSLEIPDWCTNNNNDSSGSNTMKVYSRPRDIAGIISSFDNTPRRSYEEANLFATGDPDEIVERFRKSLHSALYYEACCFPDQNLRMAKKKEEDDRFVLINAMNEWAEGMALEPSDVYGSKFLEAIRDTKRSLSKRRCSR
jgi:hypothetical protein